MRREEWDPATAEPSVVCPYCGAEGVVHGDPDGARLQRFVEDCWVCCQPWEVELRRTPLGWQASARPLS